MPEGDTIYRTAATLDRALSGRRVLRFETSLDSVAVANENTPVADRTIAGVEARGKNLFITLTPPAATPEAPVLVLYTHMRMTGAWHIYRPGERWLKPEKYARVVLHTAEFVAPCFSAPVVELLTQRQAERHPVLRELGPDAITPEFDTEEALARMQARPHLEIGVALLNQRVMAGVGNIYKSEVLFINRVSPFAHVEELGEAELRRLLADSQRLLRLNRTQGNRRTHNSLRENARLWVYGRTGEPCRVCGGSIRMRRQGMDARATYFCPTCQPDSRG